MDDVNKIDLYIYYSAGLGRRSSAVDRYAAVVLYI